MKNIFQRVFSCRCGSKRDEKLTQFTPPREYFELLVLKEEQIRLNNEIIENLREDKRRLLAEVERLSSLGKEK